MVLRRYMRQKVPVAGFRQFRHKDSDYLEPRIPMELQERILRYYNYIWSRQGGINEGHILEDLPVALRRTVSSNINGTIIANIPFFSPKVAGKDLVDALHAVLYPQIFLPGDVMVKEGEYGQEMYLLERGAVSVIAKPAGQWVKVATLGAGTYFGEASLLKSEKRNASVMAEDYCDVFVLTRDLFDEITLPYPEKREQIIASVQATIAAKSAKNKATAARRSRDYEVKKKSVNEGEEKEVEEEKDKGSHMSNEGSDSEAAAPSSGSGEKKKALEQADEDKKSPSKENEEGVERGRGDRVKVATKKFKASELPPGFPGRRGSDLAIELERADMKRKEEATRESFRHPESFTRRLWNILVLFCIIYNLVLIPLRLAVWSDPWTYAVDYILDIFLLVDVYLNLYVFGYIDEGKLFEQPDDIAARFRNSPEFWYTIVAATPIDLIVIIVALWVPSLLIQRFSCSANSYERLLPSPPRW